MGRAFVGFLLLLSLAGCERHHSDAVVEEKEHIAAQEPTPTPVATPIPSPDPAASETGAPAPEAESEPREMAADEIAVDGVVMKAALRGTGRDPRAMADEQWLVKARTSDGGRTINMHTDRAHFDKLGPGDRVAVGYRVGKYTGTVWAADFD